MSAHQKTQRPTLRLGLDATESIIRAVVVNDVGEVVARSAQNVAAGGVAQALREALRRARSDAAAEIVAAGVATPWPGEPPSPEISSAAADALGADALGMTPVAVASGTAAVVAETWCGATRGCKDVIAISVGEHVTAGLIIGGEIWKGAHGYAGSVGWLALNPVEREDYRRLGGLEAEIAAAGLVRRLVWRIKSGDHSQLVDQVGGDLARLTADLVYQGARTGDGVCISVVRDTAKYVGMAVSNLVGMLDPEAIVLGGSLASSGDMMFDPIRLECSRRLSPAQADRVKIVLSTLGSDAVAIGAARLAALAGT
jgi:predicted NBD/HSP70 family sugar kinase